MITRVLSPFIFCLFLISISSCVPWNEWQDVSMASTKSWTQTGLSSNLDTDISFLVGLKLRNVELLTDILMDVSDPRSSGYGKYYSQYQIYDLTSPRGVDVNAVTNWIKQHNGKVQIQNNGGFLRVNIKLRDAMLLFSESEDNLIQFYEFSHKITQEKIIRTPSQIHVPSHIVNKIDLFSELNDFPYKNSKKSDAHTAMNLKVLMGNNAIQVSVYANSSMYSSVTLYVTQGAYNVSQTVPISKSEILFYKSINFFNLINYELVTLQASGTLRDGSGISNVIYASDIFPSPWITPDVVNRLYFIPNGTESTNATNSQSVAEFDGQFYSTNDLSTFEHLMGIPASNVSVVGVNNENSPGVESTLDIQWITAIGRNVPTTFWYVAEGFLLVWVVQVSESPNPPLVHSISYGEPEKYQLPSHTDRLNQEFQMLGIRGVTIVSTSGDLGSSDGTSNCNIDIPDFPSSSPWTTSLGATYLYPSHQNPICSASASGLPILCSFASELPCAADTGAGFTTGGGFSSRYSRPSYQDKAVLNYLATAQLPSSNYFNASNRGFNDVAAFGSNILINIQGSVSVTGGTSASGPIFAGILALLNDVQLNRNRSPLGFVNPWLYQVSEQPGAFNQILSGNNRCQELSDNGTPNCCDSGFTAQYGWNPLTGLGTPVFSVLKENLPIG